MKTDVHLLYLDDFFLIEKYFKQKWQREIKPNVLFSILFFLENLVFYETNLIDPDRLRMKIQ
jgi:hypothetical protein